MAIKISGTTVVTDDRDITNIIDMTVTGEATFSSTASMNIPVGTEAQRPGTPTIGDFRFNSDKSVAEIYDGGKWGLVGGSALTPDNMFVASSFSL